MADYNVGKRLWGSNIDYIMAFSVVGVWSGCGGEGGREGAQFSPVSLKSQVSMGAGRRRRRTTVTRRTRARWWRWWRPTKSPRRGEERPPSFWIGLIFYLCSICYCSLRINLFTCCPMSSKWSANLQEQNNGRNGFCREAWENCRFTGPLMSELGRN